MPLVQTGRCVEAQSFPWSVVQVVDDVVALGLRDQAHARALGQVLSHQAVEVFVAPSLPRVVRRGEVDLHWEALFEQLVVMELGAVVEGDRLEQPAVLSERAGRRTRDLVLGARLELHHDRVSSLALHQREHAVAQVAAHHGVAFPVAHALSSFDLARSLGDVALAGQHPA